MSYSSIFVNMHIFLGYIRENSYLCTQYLFNIMPHIKTKTQRWMTLLCLLLTVCGAMSKNTQNNYKALHQLSSEALMEKGRNSFSKQGAAEALACFTIVSERKADSREESEMRIRALNNCACVYKFFYFDYTRAYDYFIQAYDLCEQIGFDDFLPVVMLNLGDLLNDYSLTYNSEPLAQQAHELFDKCIDKAYKSSNWELLTNSFFNLANQNYQLNLKKYHSILFSKKIPNDTPELAFVRLQYQGLRHVQHHQYDKARQCFEQQLQNINARWIPERDSLAAYMSIAKTYELENNHALAIKYLSIALQIAYDKDLNDLSPAICRQLSEQYRLTGNNELATNYHQRYTEMMEQAHAIQLSHIGELNYINQLKKEEKRTQELEQRQYWQQLVLLAAAVTLLVVLLSAVLLWLKNRELKERNRSLYEKNRQVMRIEADEQNLRKAYSKSNLNDEQRESLIVRIEEALNDANIICQQDFTLNKLAKHINSNTTYTSQVINEKYGMTFSNLLGSHRVRVACQWMDDPERYGNITIEAIASGTGFKSRTSFVNAFKRETGLKPSEYLRMAKTPQDS